MKWSPGEFEPRRILKSSGNAGWEIRSYRRLFFFAQQVKTLAQQKIFIVSVCVCPGLMFAHKEKKMSSAILQSLVKLTCSSSKASIRMVIYLCFSMQSDPLQGFNTEGLKNEKNTASDWQQSFGGSKGRRADSHDQNEAWVTAARDAGKRVR